jgi:hypothetical protein
MEFFVKAFEQVVNSNHDSFKLKMEIVMEKPERVL